MNVHKDVPGGSTQWCCIQGVSQGVLRRTDEGWYAVMSQGGTRGYLGVHILGCSRGDPVVVCKNAPGGGVWFTGPSNSAPPFVVTTGNFITFGWLKQK